MAEAALHITIQKAGDPAKLGELLKAALDAQEDPTPKEKVVVPAGYRCVECYSQDGGHEEGCTIPIQAAANANKPGGAVG